MISTEYKEIDEILNENTGDCSHADLLKEIFDNLCKKDLDEKLQMKFGEYADVVCNTIPTNDGGETYLSVGIYDIKEEVLNFSSELANILKLEISVVVDLLNTYINMYNMSIDIEYDYNANIQDIKLFTDRPYIDEDTSQDTLDLLKFGNNIEFEKKITLCLKDYMDNFMSNADKEFSYKYLEYIVCNPEY